MAIGRPNYPSTVGDGKCGCLQQGQGSNSNMDEAVEIGIIAMQTMVAKDIIQEVMVDMGAIDSKG